jgi:predicted metalloprotease
MRWLTGFLVLTLVSACQLADRPVSSGTDLPNGSPSGPSPTLDPAVHELLVRLITYKGHLNDYWSSAIVEIAPEAEYVPPRVVYYNGRMVPDFACAGPGDPPEWYVDNAFYCAHDQTVAFDANFLVGAAAAGGDMAGVLIMAHEWGHHVQHLAGVDPGFSIQWELQADCLAGMFLLHASEAGLTTEPDDLDEAAVQLLRLGNGSYRDSDWFAAGEHGPPKQRSLAMDTGLLTGNSAENCLLYANFEPQPDIEFSAANHQGGYDVSVPPETEVQTITDGEWEWLEFQRPGDPPITASFFRYEAAAGAGGAGNETADDYIQLVGYPWAEGWERSFLDPSDSMRAGFVIFGTGRSATRWYAARSLDGRQEVHGTLFFHLHPQGGGLLIDVRAPGRSTLASDIAVLAYLTQILTGLCPHEAPSDRACEFIAQT